MSIVKLNNKQLAEKYFYEHPKQASKQVCLICYPNFKDDCEESADVKLLTSSSNGYQWAKQHLDAKHKGYDSIGISSQCLLISKEAELTFRWTVQDNYPSHIFQNELEPCYFVKKIVAHKLSPDRSHEYELKWEDSTLPNDWLKPEQIDRINLINAYWRIARPKKSKSITKTSPRLIINSLEGVMLCPH
jgi:hypothetical protein